MKVEALTQVDREQARELWRQYLDDRLIRPSGYDRAWAAGFFEGEGTVRIGPASALYSLSVKVSQVDPMPIHWLIERWGGNPIPVKPCAKGARPATQWELTTVRAAIFLRDMRPYIVREQVRAKIDLALAFQSQKTRTRENRTETYRTTQRDFFMKMAVMNRRGITDVERAVMSSRLRS